MVSVPDATCRCSSGNLRWRFDLRSNGYSPLLSDCPWPATCWSFGRGSSRRRCPHDAGWSCWLRGFTATGHWLASVCCWGRSLCPRWESIWCLGSRWRCFDFCLLQFVEKPVPMNQERSPIFVFISVQDLCQLGHEFRQFLRDSLPHLLFSEEFSGISLFSLLWLE